MRILACSAFVLTLAACGGGATDTPEAGEKRSDGEIQMQAGKWSNSVVIEEFDIPGAPPEAAGMIKQLVGKERTSESCLTEEQAAKGIEEQAKKSAQSGACTTKDFSAKNGKVKGAMACKSDNGGTVDLTIDGEYDGKSMSMKMSSVIKDPNLPGGEGKMVMQMKGERIGECDAGDDKPAADEAA